MKVRGKHLCLTAALFLCSRLSLPAFSSHRRGESHLHASPPQQLQIPEWVQFVFNIISTSDKLIKKDFLFNKQFRFPSYIICALERCITPVHFDSLCCSVLAVPLGGDKLSHYKLHFTLWLHIYKCTSVLCRDIYHLIHYILCNVVMFVFCLQGIKPDLVSKASKNLLSGKEI